jgi:hypothetical protein
MEYKSTQVKRGYTTQDKKQKQITYKRLNVILDSST